VEYFKKPERPTREKLGSEPQPALHT